MSLLLLLFHLVSKMFLYIWTSYCLQMLRNLGGGKRVFKVGRGVTPRGEGNVPKAGNMCSRHKFHEPFKLNWSASEKKVLRSLRWTWSSHSQGTLASFSQTIYRSSNANKFLVNVSRWYTSTQYKRLSVESYRWFSRRTVKFCWVN